VCLRMCGSRRSRGCQFAGGGDDQVYVEVEARDVSYEDADGRTEVWFRRMFQPTIQVPPP
jgi:hypothetical protein